jgi:hypothetical protein
VAFRSMVADYEEASGNKIDYSIMPFMALSQKTVCALTTEKYLMSVTGTPQPLRRRLRGTTG